MNKKELIRFYAERYGVPISTAGVRVKAVLDTIEAGIKEEGDVSIIGFGHFKSVLKPLHEARNPKTGETVVVPARRTVKFKASKVLAD